MCATVLALYFLLFPANVARAADFVGSARGRAQRVIDGDTVKMRVAIWLDQEILVSVRLAGVDAPELFRPGCEAERSLAQDAKKFAELFLAGRVADLSDIQRDKYAGRVVARIRVRRADLGDALVSKGLAAKAQKGAWC